MDSISNLNTFFMQTQLMEETKHKIWSPVPTKLRKIEDENALVRSIVIVNDGGDSPISWQNRKTSHKSFEPNNSAFRFPFNLLYAYPA